MNHFNFLFLTAAFVVFGANSFAGTEDDCACPTLSCTPCQDSQGLDFYTQKCEGQAKLKSCAKPLCKPKQPLPVGCVTKPPEPAVVGDHKVEPPQTVHPKFGDAEFVSGSVLVEHNKQSFKIKTGDEVFEGDSVETDSTSEARIKTLAGDVVHVQKSSKVVLAALKNESEPTTLQLLRGKIRSQILKRKQQAPSFQIETRSAVTGVRGTDFITTFQAEPKEQTLVQTLDGDVVLYGKRAPDKKVHVRQAEFASYTVNQKSVDADSEEFVIDGILSTVQSMNEAMVQELKESSWVGVRTAKRELASEKNDAKDLCQHPSGNLNQCSWTCVNNPAHEKTCRTDRADVQCVRKRCNANGEWTEETRLPASFHEFCEPDHSRVAPCDY